MIKDVNGSWANWILDQCMILVNVAEQTYRVKVIQIYSII